MSGAMETRTTDPHAATRAIMAFERRCNLQLVEAALEANHAAPPIVAALHELRASIEERGLAVGMQFKGGTIGSEHDRYKFGDARRLGCTCCPHIECICEEGCEPRCSYHAPLIIAELEKRERAVVAHLRALFELARLLPEARHEEA